MSMTHISMPEEARAASGIQRNLISVSADIENVEDLIADLDQALAVV